MRRFTRSLHTICRRSSRLGETDVLMVITAIILRARWSCSGSCSYACTRYPSAWPTRPTSCSSRSSRCCAFLPCSPISTRSGRGVTACVDRYPRLLWRLDRMAGAVERIAVPKPADGAAQTRPRPRLSIQTGRSCSFHAIRDQKPHVKQREPTHA